MNLFDLTGKVTQGIGESLNGKIESICFIIHFCVNFVIYDVDLLIKVVALSFMIMSNFKF